MSALIRPFYEVIMVILSIVEWTIVVWVVISWIIFFASHTSFRRRHPQGFYFLETLNDIFTRVTYPFLRPIRRRLGRYAHVTAGIDWSPLVLLVIIFFLRQLLTALFSYTGPAVLK